MAFVQSRSSAEDPNATTIVLAYSGAVTSGNFLWCVIGNESGQTVSSVSDSVNGAWSLALTAVNTPNTQRTTIYYRHNTGAGTPTVTVTFSAGSNWRRLSILEESGVATSSALDKTGSAIGTGTSANSGSVTPDSNGQTLAGALQAAAGGVTATGSWTTRATDAASEAVGFDQVQTTAAAVALTATVSITNWLAAIATFRAPAASFTWSNTTSTALLLPKKHHIREMVGY